jgi:hypothetical protein
MSEETKEIKRTDSEKPASKDSDSSRCYYVDPCGCYVDPCCCTPRYISGCC